MFHNLDLYLRSDIIYTNTKGINLMVKNLKHILILLIMCKRNMLMY